MSITMNSPGAFYIGGQGAEEAFQKDLLKILKIRFLTFPLINPPPSLGEICAAPVEISTPEIWLELKNHSFHISSCRH